MTEPQQRSVDSSRPGRPPRASVASAVAVVAILAGMGTATVGRRTEPDPARPAAVGTARVRSISPRIVELVFNPRVPRGLKVAKVAFRFTLEHPAAARDEVRERTDARWELLVSNLLRTLKRRGPEELKQDAGLDAIEADLRRTIDATLFVDGLAAACEIVWEQILVQ